MVTLEEVQKRLTESGVRVGGFTFDPSVRDKILSGELSMDEVKQDVANLLYSYSNGNFTEFVLNEELTE